MKVGDSIVCIDNEYSEFTLSNGKVYKLITYITLHDIVVINDLGEEDMYNDTRFISLCKYRKLKLEKINGR